MHPPENNDEMFERFLEGDDELAAALAAVEGEPPAGEPDAQREENVLAAGLRFVQNLRDMGE